jgi:hypothetical protein
LVHSLPATAVPAWANKMSDDDWNAMIRDRLQHKSELQSSESKRSPET